jgi:hypothetical protein
MMQCAKKQEKEDKCEFSFGENKLLNSNANNSLESSKRT